MGHVNKAYHLLEVAVLGEDLLYLQVHVFLEQDLVSFQVFGSITHASVASAPQVSEINYSEKLLSLYNSKILYNVNCICTNIPVECGFITTEIQFYIKLFGDSVIVKKVDCNC